MIVAASSSVSWTMTLYVGACQTTRQGSSGWLVCVDGESHKIRWQYQVNELIESTPVVGNDGMIYFGDNAGWVYALTPHGDKQWSAKFEAAIRSAGTILAPNMLAFALDDDVLVAMRCESKDIGGQWPKFGHDHFHSFVGPERVESAKTSAEDTESPAP